MFRLKTKSIFSNKKIVIGIKWNGLPSKRAFFCNIEKKTKWNGQNPELTHNKVFVSCFVLLFRLWRTENMYRVLITRSHLAYINNFFFQLANFRLNPFFSLMENSNSLLQLKAQETPLKYILLFLNRFFFLQQIRDHMFAIKCLCFSIKIATKHTTSLCSASNICFSCFSQSNSMYN